MRDHNELVDDAKEAIDKVHGDSDVSQETTIESLNDIIGHAELLRDTVETDIQNAAREAGAADVDGEV